MRAVTRLIDKGFEAYLVGGCVRDLLLDRQPKDYDIATAARPPQVKRTFPRNSRIIGRRFKLAHLHFHGNTKILECSTFRRTPQERPQDGGDGADADLLITRDNEFGTAEQDALRRDFTINALFLDPTRDLIVDHVQGLEDIEARVIRTIGDPVVRFREDPVRILRAAKFAGRLGFSIEEKTLAAMAETAEDLVRAAPPRVLEEILRLLRSGHAQSSFELLRDVGAIEYLVPVVGRFLKDADDQQISSFWALLAALDQHVQAQPTGSEPPPNGVILAVLMFGAVERERAQQPSRSASSVAEKLLGSLAVDLRLPRRDSGCLKRICGVLHRFSQPEDKRRFRVESFIHSPYFEESLQLFELRTTAENGDPQIVDHWHELTGKQGRPTNDGDGAHESSANDESPNGATEDEPRQKRRRRRRRQPVSEDPKTDKTKDKTKDSDLQPNDTQPNANDAQPNDAQSNDAQSHDAQSNDAQPNDEEPVIASDHLDGADDLDGAEQLDSSAKRAKSKRSSAPTKKKSPRKKRTTIKAKRVEEEDLSDVTFPCASEEPTPAKSEDKQAPTTRAQGDDRDAPRKRRSRRSPERATDSRDSDQEDFAKRDTRDRDPRDYDEPRDEASGEENTGRTRKRRSRRNVDRTSDDNLAREDRAREDRSREDREERTARNPERQREEEYDREDASEDYSDADREVSADSNHDDGDGRKRRRRGRRGRGRGRRQAEERAGNPEEAEVAAEGKQEAERSKPRATKVKAKKSGSKKREPQKRDSRRDGKRGKKPAKTSGQRDVDVVPRYRDRRGKVEVIEPVNLDLSAFDVELDPKRVPTFGSIVEGKSRPKRRGPNMPDRGSDEYRPPPPPGSDGSPSEAPKPPPPADGPDTFGDW